MFRTKQNSQSLHFPSCSFKDTWLNSFGNIFPSVPPFASITYLLSSTLYWFTCLHTHEHERLYLNVVRTHAPGTIHCTKERDITGKAASIHQAWPSVQLKLLRLNKTTRASIVLTQLSNLKVYSSLIFTTSMAVLTKPCLYGCPCDKSNKNL
jgi:hypothetical protein